MLWKVEGADAATGADASVIIQASDEKEAARRAREGGILAASVSPGPSELPPRSFTELMEKINPSTKIETIAEQSERHSRNTRNFINGVLNAFLVVYAMLAIPTGIMLFFSQGFTGTRFQSENAIGTAANALESIYLLLQISTALISGLLAVIALRVRRR